MSSNSYTTTISLPENPLLNISGNYNTSVDEPTKQQDTTTIQPIIVQDISDLYISEVSDSNFLLAIGLIPNKLIFTDWQKKLLLASFFSLLFSIWASNQLVLSVFITLNFLNFVTSIFVEKQVSFRQKLAYLINEALLVGLISGIAELLIGKINIPFTPFYISLLYISALFMSFYYLYEIVRRIYPITSLSKSKTLVNFILSIKDGFKYGRDKFDERQEKDTLSS